MASTRQFGPATHTLAKSLEAVSPTGPMTHLALRIGLGHAMGRPATEQEIDQTPRIPEDMTRTEYAQTLRTQDA